MSTGFFTTNSAIVAVVTVVVFSGEVFAPDESNCIRELTTFGFSEQISGSKNLKKILPKKYTTKYWKHCEGYPTYEQIVVDIPVSPDKTSTYTSSDYKLGWEVANNITHMFYLLWNIHSKCLKTPNFITSLTTYFSINEYSELYYEHLMEFCEVDNLMLTIENWCAIYDCSEALDSDKEFKFESDITAKKYFHLIANKVALKKESHTLCTLSVCHAEINDTFLQEKITDNLSRNMNMDLTQVTQMIRSHVNMGFQQRYVNRIFKFISRRSTHLIQNKITFCAAQVCYSELALAGFQDQRSGLLNKIKKVPEIIKKPDFVQNLKGYAKEFLDYLNDSFNDLVVQHEDKPYNFAEFDDLKYQSQNTNEICTTKIIGVDSNFKNELFMNNIISVAFADKYGLPLFDWCLIEVCRHQLFHAGFIHETYFLNWKYVHYYIVRDDLQFEFAIKYYDHITRMYDEREFDQKTDLPADSRSRGPLEWCKFTILWF